ncbi:MAG: DUF4288 domain-containing protein [Sphingobacteriaceae bacterium]|nr:DUF4288 domain-containing protein [Sphingobacteriaceae bacterium]
MNSYIVKLVFNINIEEGLHRSQFDEQTILINASSLEDAFYKAKTQGKILEEKFSNDKDQSVEWKFIDVVDVFELRSYKMESRCILPHTKPMIQAHLLIIFITVRK